MSHIEKTIDYTFQNNTLLKKAITHPSAVSKGHGIDFERLEFLGDRVLGLVIATWLFERYPDEEEGDLAKRYTNLVCKETLVSIAEKIELSQDLIMRREKSSSTQKRLETLLADGCEALIGALYLDGGLSCAQNFIHKYWEGPLKEALNPPRDPKSFLQEWAQAQGKHHPIYVLVQSSGPAHSPSFIVEVQIQGFDSIQGKGSSKKLAEKDAAQHLLDKIFTS